MLGEREGFTATLPDLSSSFTRHSFFLETIFSLPFQSGAARFQSAALERETNDGHLVPPLLT